MGSLLQQLGLIFIRIFVSEWWGIMVFGLGAIIFGWKSSEGRGEVDSGHL